MSKNTAPEMGNVHSNSEQLGRSCNEGHVVGVSRRKKPKVRGMRAWFHCSRFVRQTWGRGGTASVPRGKDVVVGIKERVGVGCLARNRVAAAQVNILSASESGCSSFPVLIYMNVIFGYPHPSLHKPVTGGVQRHRRASCISPSTRQKCAQRNG